MSHNLYISDFFADNQNTFTLYSVLFTSYIETHLAWHRSRSRVEATCSSIAYWSVLYGCCRSYVNLEAWFFVITVLTIFKHDIAVFSFLWHGIVVFSFLWHSIVVFSFLWHGIVVFGRLHADYKRSSTSSILGAKYFTLCCFWWFLVIGFPWDTE